MSLRLHRSTRFIPTPVGNTPTLSTLPHLPPVHPHARGEHRYVVYEVNSFFGSSPRPWGTRDHVVVGSDGERFIPTPVGNTFERFVIDAAELVHPHARGEHFLSLISKPPCSGSSPRPWGTPLTLAGHRPSARFIPTPVGNTATSRRRRGPATVHPHARGEHV